MTDAATRGARGGGITLAGQAAKLCIQFTSVVVLSRILSPEDFGLIAMVAAFVALGELIRDFGTSVVGLQRATLTQQQASNLFWLSSGLGLIASVLLACATPLLVLVYGEPRLGGIVPALSVGVLLNAMASQLQVQLARSMRYRRLVAADVVSPALGLGAAIVGAVLGWQYWALVAQVLVTAAAGLALRWIASAWAPARPRRESQNRAMLRDSASFGLAQALSYLSANLDTIVVGARWDAFSVGSYSRGYQLLTLPLNSVMTPLTQVVIPTVNGAMKEGRSADSVLLRIQFGLGLVLIWVFVVTAGIADWLVPLVLGPGWQATIRVFQILAVGGMVWVHTRVNYWRVVISNLGRQLVVFNIVTKTMTSALIFAAAFFSIEAVAWAVSFGLVITWPIALIWFARPGGWDSWAYFWVGMRQLVPGGFAYLVTLAVMNAPWDIPQSLLALIAVVGGTIVYIGAMVARPSSRGDIIASLRLVRRITLGGRVE